MTTPTLKRFDLSWLGKDTPVILRATVECDGREVDLLDKFKPEAAATWKAIMQEAIRMAMMEFV